MKGKKIALIVVLVIVLIALAVVLGVKLMGDKEPTVKVYEGAGLKIVLTGDYNVSIYNADDSVFAENIVVEDTEAPEGTENPENYSRFVKVNVMGGDMIAKFTNDGKKIVVDSMEFVLQEQSK